MFRGGGQKSPPLTDEALISRGSNQSLACFVWSCISKLTSFPFIFGKSSQGSFVTLYLFCMWSSFIVNEMCAKFQVHIYINLYPSLREGRKNVSLQTVNGPLTNRFLTVNVNETFKGREEVQTLWCLTFKISVNFIDAFS